MIPTTLKFSYASVIIFFFSKFYISFMKAHTSLNNRQLWYAFNYYIKEHKKKVNKVVSEIRQLIWNDMHIIAEDHFINEGRPVTTCGRPPDSKTSNQDEQ